MGRAYCSRKRTSQSAVNGSSGHLGVGQTAKGACGAHGSGDGWGDDQYTRGRLERAEGWLHIRLGGPEQFGRGLWREAERRGWEHARETEALGDGAAWIWNQVQDHFYTSHQVVDWYHGADHLAVAARSLHGEGTDAAKRWLKRNRLALYQGHAARIAQELTFAATENGAHADTLKREAGYFHHHQRRMNYLEMRENGWLIGSGVVESGIKQFKARFAGPGMRWSRAGAERLLPICETILSHRFDHIWNAAYYSPQN